jgi:hypothetical protein
MVESQEMCETLRAWSPVVGMSKEALHRWKNGMFSISSLGDQACCGACVWKLQKQSRCG